MAQRILIMGLPGAGKTTLAEALRDRLWQLGRTVTWLNADAVRQQHNDWDFSQEGRIRQSQRMRESADTATTDYVIADFVAPLNAMRSKFDADWTVWVDTIKESRFADTDVMFIPPTSFEYDFRVTEQAADQWSEVIAEGIATKTELGVQ
jgi:adenylylsulfate kinase